MSSVQKHLKGIHVDHCKNTSACPVTPITLPEKVYIPMSQHIGAPCQPTVAVGDHVKVGQVIGDNAAPVCAPIHASVSGEVTAIEQKMTAQGRVDTVIVITADGKQEPADTVVPPVVTNKEEFLKAVRASGAVGLGGAGFPTHIKFNPRNPEEVDTLIVNGAECEPYITVDHQTMLTNAQDIMDGMKHIMHFLNLKKGIIGIETNKPDAIAKFKELFKDSPELEVCELQQQYPQGAERVLCYESTGRHLIAGKLPADVGVIISNVSTILKMEIFLKTGMPLVTKSITVDGNAITKPQNVEAPIGTPLTDIIEFCGGYSGEPKKIILGGPMMGRAIPNDDVCVVKGTSAILVFDEAFAQINPETACINCGRCVKACPMNLVPAAIYKAYINKDLDALNKYHAMTCMSCGCCTYVCPARKQLSFINGNLVKGFVNSQGGKK
ncbi:MAG: electron transport complex subunit RsxC [Firmicutes bacterium]|nr:electron transport complex subunit RsxC [Bacillota bacterium]